MATECWLTIVAEVGCRKFASGVTGGGGRKLTRDDQRRWCLKVG